MAGGIHSIVYSLTYHFLPNQARRTWKYGNTRKTKHRLKCTCSSLQTDAIKKYLQNKYRAPQCMSPRRNWDSPNPSPASERGIPPGAKGGGHICLRLRSSNSDDWRKSLALCLLCACKHTGRKRSLRVYNYVK